MTYCNGIDVSRYQSNINIPAIKIKNIGITYFSFILFNIVIFFIFIYTIWKKNNEIEIKLYEGIIGALKIHIEA